MPFKSVGPDVGENAAAPAGVALQVTVTPSIGSPSDPRAVKLSGTGRLAPLDPDWLSPATPVTDAAPGPLESPPQANPSAAMPTNHRFM
jgi:hypothetical protein